MARADVRFLPSKDNASVLWLTLFRKKELPSNVRLLRDTPKKKKERSRGHARVHLIFHVFVLHRVALPSKKKEKQMRWALQSRMEKILAARSKASMPRLTALNASRLLRSTISLA